MYPKDKFRSKKVQNMGRNERRKKLNRRKDEIAFQSRKRNR